MTGYVQKTLNQIAAELPIVACQPAELPETPVRAVTFDSRQVQPGTIFVATIGGTTDGHKFIPAAIEKGAIAVIGTQPLMGIAVPYLQVPDSRAALAWVAAALYDFPGRDLRVIGVTGTDGKTTTSNLIYQILLSAGVRVGVISTVNAVIGDEVVDTGFHVTTPEAPDVQRYMARMVAAGLTHVVLETTSHGLVQHRVTGCEFDIGVLTNITHEHLDYHGTYEAYRDAKALLFSGLEKTHDKAIGNLRLSVLNYDDKSYPFLHEIVKTPQISYGLGAGADITAEDVRYSPSGLCFTAVGGGHRFEIKSSLVGQYNVSNCLAAASAALFGLEMDVEDVQRGIATLRGVPGRMERIQAGQDFLAIVDFAHTPNALKVTLQAARQMTEKRVIAVFGAAGLRDRQKRHMMAEISAKLADITILTAEDPRTESLDSILAEMAKAASEAGGVEGTTYFRVPDRGEAIRLGVKLAQAGDIVISCGKGHEQSMCFGETEFAWDDRTAMRAALAERLGTSGPAMPYLPTQG